MPEDSADRIATIRQDLAYFRTAHRNAGVGLPPTVHAAKYADDVGFLLNLLTKQEPEPVTKSQLELELEQDVAGRTERRPQNP